MAANHIAMVRSSARMANIRSHEAAHQDDTATNPSSELSRSGDNLGPNSNIDSRQSLADELSQLSVISSISSGHMDAEIRDKSVGSSQRKGSLVPEPMVAKLKRLETVSHVDECIDAGLSQENTLDGLERNWKAISDQFQTVVEHLARSSKEVSSASENCLKSLVDSIELTCDKVDGEMKALYQLMSKCDELTTKLSVAGSFREEIKALRKSVETLEVIHRNKPKPSLSGARRNRGTIPL